MEKPTTASWPVLVTLYSPASRRKSLSLNDENLFGRDGRA